MNAKLNEFIIGLLCIFSSGFIILLTLQLFYVQPLLASNHSKHSTFFYYGVYPDNYYNLNKNPAISQYYDNGTDEGVYYGDDGSLPNYSSYYYASPSYYTDYTYPSYPYNGTYYKKGFAYPYSYAYPYKAKSYSHRVGTSSSKVYFRE